MHTKRNNTWLVVGTSPDVELYIDTLLPMALHSITANSGWQLFATSWDVAPEYYWISDGAAALAHRRAVGWMSKHQGVRILTRARPQFAIDAMELPIVPDELVDLGGVVPQIPTYTPGKNVHPTLSGLICLQYALNHGADRVILVGHSGYVSTPGNHVVDSFDGRKGKDGSADQTRLCIRPFIQSAIEAMPHVQFIVAGKLNYQLTCTPGGNLTLLRTPQECAEWIAHENLPPSERPHDPPAGRGDARPPCGRESAPAAAIPQATAAQLPAAAPEALTAVS